METLLPEIQTTRIEPHFAAKRTFFDHGHTRSHAFRAAQLKGLASAINLHEQAIAEALYADLRKSPAESFFTETALVQQEIKNVLKHLQEWMTPDKRSTPLILQPSSSRVVYEPKGVVLIIAPWNYPFQLAIMPLVSALAAGNCAVIKPSEEAPHTAALIEKMVQATFAPEVVSVVLGPGKEVVPALMDSCDFNHIFFTGSPAVGRIIARHAADKITPITLELGGKNPGIVDASANVKVAARRLVFGKFTNAGQTCVAPDYLLLHESIKDQFIKEAIAAIKHFYGSDPQKSNDYGRMINARRFKAVAAYITDGHVLHGGQTDAADLYIAPTLLDNVDRGAAVMNEEIFGPVWPVLTWKDRSELLSITREHRYPLSAYIFTSDKAMEKWAIDNIGFGGGCINNAIVQFGNHNLPFGGVMQSGNGSYHGWEGFATFSHGKSIIDSATWADPGLKYPPYGKIKMGLIKRLFGL